MLSGKLGRSRTVRAMPSNTIDTDTTESGSTQTDSTATDERATATEGAQQETERSEAAGPAPTADAPATPDATTDPSPRTGGGRALPGALAVASAGLGLSSLTGTSLADMMRAREEIVGQIAAATGGSSDQVGALYTAPWHTAALVNGVFAILAVLAGGLVLVLGKRRPATAGWLKAAATGGLVLGVIGLLVAVGMSADLFASAPVLPRMPSMPGMGG